MPIASRPIHATQSVADGAPKAGVLPSVLKRFAHHLVSRTESDIWAVLRLRKVDAASFQQLLMRAAFPAPLLPSSVVIGKTAPPSHRQCVDRMISGQTEKTNPAFTNGSFRSNARPNALDSLGST